MQVNASTFRSATMTFPAAVPLRRRDDAVLTGLIDNYGTQGGLASPDEIIGLMRPHWRQPVSMLAKWIVGRKVLSFAWRSQILLPLFQFERPRMTPIQAVGDCSQELGELMDDEGVASWFVRPCEWLDQRMPVDALLDDPELVAHAAARTRLAMIARRLSD